MKKHPLWHLPPFYWALLLLMMVALTLSLKTHPFIFKRTHLGFCPTPPTQTKTDPTTFDQVKTAYERALGQYNAQLMKLVSDPSRVASVAIAPDHKQELFTLMNAPVDGINLSSSMRDRCVNGCTFYLHNLNTDVWKEIFPPDSGDIVLSRLPVWTSDNRILTAYAFGDGPVGNETFYQVNTETGEKTMFAYTSEAFSSVEEMNDPSFRGQTSFRFTSVQGDSAPAIQIAWSENRKRWVARITADRMNGHISATDTLLPSPTSSSATDAVHINLEDMYTGKADISFTWFGHTYFLNGRTLKEKH